MSTATTALDNAVDQIRLVDHHVHGALRADVDRATLETMLTESDRPIATGTTQFDSQLDFAIRRWCAPVLGLPRHASPESYCARRAELGAPEITRRFLRASGIGHYLLETGYRGDAKVLFSSDAWGPPELHLLGALLWRRGMRRALARWVAEDEWSGDDAVRVARMIGRDNARRVYRLGRTGEAR